MKLIALIARLRPRAKTVRWIETRRDWSVRDWADLPAYHPLRRD